MASTVLPNGIIIPEKYSRDWYNDLYHNWQELDNLLGGGTPKDGTLTIQKNGDTVGTFSANQATDETINIEVPTKTSDLNNDSGFITGVSWNDVSNKPSFATVATSGSYNDLSNKPTIPTVNDATLTIQKNGTTVETFTANSSSDKTVNISVPTKVSEVSNDLNYIRSLNNYMDLSWSTPVPDKINIKVDQTWIGGILTTANTTIPTNTSDLANDSGFITADYAVPRSGGAVMTGTNISRVDDTNSFEICGGRAAALGGRVMAYGKDSSPDVTKGAVVFNAHNGENSYFMWLFSDGTWTWQGAAVQLVSDQRLKQQISNIDDKLLDAWEDVDLVQFKYNDAVDQKKDKARLHTGYVVQQIDNACKEHGVDISTYGLYCHEEYPQETEEVEVEQADGTKTKETKVIREASEHYSLRYTEVYAVECMYLRRCIARLTARIEELEKGNNTK